MRLLASTATLFLALGGAALAQPATAPGATAPGGAVVAPTPGNTGNDPNVNISRGGTGASSVQTNSATGGNAQQPERAVPQGSGGGSR
ncbi:hypothetical protein [uncultured Methylobacterium sp.]|jgi:hypothetical protein|uniref:hypothetical protein n=1 Tax=uncultured Methylobacterium sp. TaxID=157278 RepID=UPI002630E58A|nr:hypothetical protein [uncultured Methylobacterium sp.]